MSTFSRATWWVSSFVVTASLAAPAAAVPVAANTCGGLDGDVVCQEVVVEAAGLGRREDIVAGTTSADINRNILASLSGSTALARASAGVFGAVGLEGRVGSISVASLSSKVTITSEELQNVTGGDAAASGFFIIDGGRMMLIGGQGSRITYSIQVVSQYLTDPSELVGLTPVDETGSPFDENFNLIGQFRATGELRQTSTGVELSTSGTDIGVVRDARRATQFNIPLSLQTIDFGIVPSGYFLDIEYTATFAIEVAGFAEAISFEFSDPLNLAGPDAVVFPQVTFTPLSPAQIPEPGTLFLAAAGFASLARLRRRATNAQ
jgi:hypothetical protein